MKERMNQNDSEKINNMSRLDSVTPDPTREDAYPAIHSPMKGKRRVDQPDFIEKLDSIIAECGGDTEVYEGKLIREQLITALKLITDDRDTGELKLLTTAFKELRYAYQVFSKYPDRHKISIFGSARTPPENPDYQACVEFSRLMAANNWLCITGAGDGIMKAGHEGPGAAASFGLAIRLPFETTANDVIAGDDKLINFRYFFTRKLMFVSQCEAVAVFPGGYGTQDEIFEALTLVQTGKSAMVPIVLCEAEGSTYWEHWDNYVRRSLLNNGMISPEDLNLYYITRDMEDAVEHITRFYRNYHSSRYVKDDLVIRVKKPLEPGDVRRLNEEFSSLVASGEIVQRGPYEVEEDMLELPRIAFHHTRHNIGLVRRMIDRINEFTPASSDHLHPSEIY
ncbi:MAG: LOG family protein [Phycisphaerales bacterium]